jgi:hypothetical protein
MRKFTAFVFIYIKNSSTVHILHLYVKDGALQYFTFRILKLSTKFAKYLYFCAVSFKIFGKYFCRTFYIHRIIFREKLNKNFAIKNSTHKKFLDHLANI